MGQVVLFGFSEDIMLPRYVADITSSLVAGEVKKVSKVFVFKKPDKYFFENFIFD